MVDVDIQKLKQCFEACAAVLRSPQDQQASDALDILRDEAEDPKTWQASIQHGYWVNSGVLQAVVERFQEVADMATSDQQQQRALVAQYITVLSLMTRDPDLSRSMHGAVPHLLQFLVDVHTQPEQQAAATALSNICAASATGGLQQHQQDLESQLQHVQEQNCALQQQLQQLQQEQKEQQEVDNDRLLLLLRVQEENSVLRQQLQQAQQDTDKNRLLLQQVQEQDSGLQQQLQQLQQAQQEADSNRLLLHQLKKDNSSLHQQLQKKQQETDSNRQLLQQVQEHNSGLQQQLQQEKEADNNGLLLQQLQQEHALAAECLLLVLQQLRQAQGRCTAFQLPLQQQVQCVEQSPSQHQSEAASHTPPKVAALQKLWQDGEAECSALLQCLQEFQAEDLHLQKQAEALDTSPGRLRADWQLLLQHLQEAAGFTEALWLQQTEQQTEQQLTLQEWSRIGDARLQQLLSHNDAAVAEAAVSELARRVSELTIDLGTVGRSCADSLLQLLATGSAAAQKDAVFVLHHSIDITDAAAADRIVAGGLEQLKQLLDASNSAEVQEHAAAAVARLAGCCASARDLQLVPPLVALLISPSEGVQHCAAAALNNIALDPTCIPTILKENGIEQVVQMLSSSNQKVQNQALVALRSIVCFDARSKSAVRRAKGLAFVVDLIKSNDVGVQINAAKAVCALVAGSQPGNSSSANREDLIDLGAPAALQLLKQSSNPVAQAAAIAASKVLGCCDAHGRQGDTSDSNSHYSSCRSD